MYRQFLTETSGRTFLQKFRNGIQTLDAEIEKLETMTADLDYPNLPRTYFQDQISFLSNIDSVLDETEQLHREVSTTLFGVDHIENRLLSLRERLLRFEEDPKLLSRGYRPFVPNDFIENEGNEETDSVTSISEQVRNESDAESHDKILTECFNQKLPTQTDSLNSHENSLNILSTVKKTKNNIVQQKSVKKKSKIDIAKINNPMIARGFTICNRWLKDDQNNSLDQNNGHDINVSNENDSSASFNLLSTIKKNNDNNEKNTHMVNTETNSFQQQNLNQVKINPNFTPSIRNRLFNLDDKSTYRSRITPKASLKKNQLRERSKQVNNFLQDEYETVEFTPGMTTKIRKSSDKR